MILSEQARTEEGKTVEIREDDRCAVEWTDGEAKQTKPTGMREGKKDGIPGCQLWALVVALAWVATRLSANGGNE